MKAALIPPVQALGQFGNGPFHLLLSHLFESRRYFQHYRVKRQQGAYLVLDNSAHEIGEGDDPSFLMQKALMMDAQEVVVPDALDDSDRTIELALQAHEAWFEGKFSDTPSVKAKALMYVPQGSNYEEWQFCLDNLVRIHLFSSKRYDLRQDFVIGVSKDYEAWDGGLMHLIEEDILPLRCDLGLQGIKMHVHMLGWGRDLWALEEIAARHNWIRSTDSAKPFVYAMAGNNLYEYLDHEPPLYPKRPPNYFSRRMNPVQTLCATTNAMLFRAIASGSRSNTVMV